MSYYSQCNKKVSVGYTQINYATLFQILLDAVLCISGFSIALNLSTLHSMLYLDACTCFTLGATIYKFHLLATSLFDCHNGAFIYEVFGKYMGAVILK